jgi:SMI1 / KNR4 family (SUKH-1)
MIDLLMRDGWNRSEPSTLEEILRLENELALKFPKDFIDLMTWSNGGEGQIGTAYFLFWPIQKIIPRNSSAQIQHYMSNKFVGIGTNGGGECYGLDYLGHESPSLAIVPLGDLSTESKFQIAPSIAEAFQAARDGLFSDGDYNSKESGPLTNEMKKIHENNKRMRLNQLWEKKDFEKYLMFFDKESIRPTEIDSKKILIAKKNSVGERAFRN